MLIVLFVDFSFLPRFSFSLFLSHNTSFSYKTTWLERLLNVFPTSGSSFRFSIRDSEGRDKKIINAIADAVRKTRRFIKCMVYFSSWLHRSRCWSWWVYQQNCLHLRWWQEERCWRCSCCLPCCLWTHWYDQAPRCSSQNGCLRCLPFHSYSCILNINVLYKGCDHGWLRWGFS